MNEEEIRKKDEELIQSHLNALSEHFDAVQIIACRHEAGALDGTLSVWLGSGNVFARIGVVQEWLLSMTERSKERCRIQEREDN